MTKPDDILKSFQWHQNISKVLGASQQISSMFKAQRRMTKNLNSIGAAYGIFKDMQQHQLKHEKSALLAILDITVTRK